MQIKCRRLAFNHLAIQDFNGGYNVTDKADGLRCLLFVDEIGMIFLVDGGGRVYATGKQTEPDLKGTVLDGEWIRKNRHGADICQYLAFDILASKNGDITVTKLPFLIADVMSVTTANKTRHSILISIVTVLSVAKQTRSRVTNTLFIGMKMFRGVTGSKIFQVASETLDDAKKAIYNTDGLIFTPNASPMPGHVGVTWPEQLKWKPSHENTIDFLILVDDSIGIKYRQDMNETVQYKTLRLFVGSNTNVAFADPRRTITMSEEIPTQQKDDQWRATEFRPMDPRDSMASVCYVQIDPETDNTIRAKSNDILQSNMITEMSYHPEREPINKIFCARFPC